MNLLLLPLLFGALCLAGLIYWIARRLPLPAPPPRARAFRPVAAWEAYLQRELDLAGLAMPVRFLLYATAASAAAGGLLAYPLKNLPLTVIVGLVTGSLPYRLLQVRIRRRQQAVQTAVEPALVLIAKIYEVRRHPFLALTDASEMLQAPLRQEMAQALLESQSGQSLPEALREMATRCGDNFYLHQLAELVAINIRNGGDLSGSLLRLASRLRTMSELRAEETAELFGYHWLTKLLFAATLLPIPYWLLTGSASLQVFVVQPLPRALLVWVVASGLVIISLPYWLAIEE